MLIAKVVDSELPFGFDLVFHQDLMLILNPRHFLLASVQGMHTSWALMPEHYGRFQRSDDNVHQHLIVLQARNPDFQNVANIQQFHRLVHVLIQPLFAFATCRKPQLLRHKEYS
ncbi:hypothetical protein Mapa_008849 [Marchantia paleacea]|nr:hypothetical protein Mapa_008849 [Marchantia paleacea]